GLCGRVHRPRRPVLAPDRVSHPQLRRRPCRGRLRGDPGARPDADRTTTRLGQIAAPVPPAYTADPGSPAGSLLGRPPLRGQLLAVVVEDRRVTGLVTTDELRLALLRARLRTGQPAGTGQ